MNLWEVAFNDLKQFARVDSKKQGGGGGEEHLLLKETDLRYDLNQASALSFIPKSDSRRPISLS